MKINLPIPVQRRYDVSHHLRAVDTPVGFPAEKANSYWTVLSGLLLFMHFRHMKLMLTTIAAGLLV